MKISVLMEWREKFKTVDGTPQIKVVAKDFRNEFDLWKLKGHQIYELLRDCEDFVQLLRDVEVNNDPACDAAAPELLEACRHALFTLEHAHSVADDWYASANSGIQEALNDMLPGEDDHCATSKLRAAISKAEGKQ